LQWAEPEFIVERVLNPFMLVAKATERMAVFSWRNIVSIRKMITGDVSVATLGGPILIGKIAGESISRGLIAFLTTMAVLSVGLGIINILPVPVLDGGHLLLLGIEMVRGKPLTIRQMEVVQQVGFSLIVLLMVVVMKNDLSRLPIFN
jgi:regulator of sigma E protease